MSQVEWLIGIGRRIFDHDQGSIGRRFPDAVTGIRPNAVQQFDPVIRSDGYVEETFYDIIGGDQARFVLFEVFADFTSRLFGSFLADTQERKHDHGEMPLELFLGFLQGDHLRRQFLAV